MKNIKHIVIILAVLIALATTYAEARNIVKTNSRISEVVVYPDRALITRSLSQKVPSGTSLLEISGLPGIISDNTVRVKGKSKGKVTIRDVTVKRVYHTDIPEGKVKELEAQIEALNDKDDTLEARSRVYGEQIKFLKAIKPKKPGKDNKSAKRAGLNELNAINSILGNSLAKAKEEKRKIKIERRGIQKKIRALGQELNKIKRPKQRVEKKILVEVHASGPANIRLDVNYIVASASWTPLYDLRANLDKSEMEIIAKADIRQSTGEDWRGVKLSVSTAKPAMGGVLPRMSKWTIDLYRPPPPAPKPPPMKRAPRMAFKMEMEEAGPVDFLGAEMLDDAPEPIMEAEVIVAEADYKGTAATFTIPRAFTVPSDGENHRAVIAKEKFSTEFVYSTTPKLSSLAYLRAKVTNESGHPFIPGAASVFMGNTYVGNTAIKAWGPGQEMTISLGPDQGIKVTRDEVSRELKEGRTNKLTISYKIKVENFRKKAVKLEVFDHIPVPLNKDIDVEVEMITPEPKKKKANGILKWEMPLQAGGKTEIRYTIIIKYPSSRPVSNLP